ncbi:hypothetical protein ABT009_46750 [Streptomyces sp. NPDC002896]|uniref:hypothetical protein n=1 Tax=Streptomyces sp. NPDC002896 TaxID=3154438 RepID=UPI00331BC5F7
MIDMPDDEYARVKATGTAGVTKPQIFPYFARQWQQMPAAHFMAVFGPYAQRIDEVLDAFRNQAPDLLVTAAAQVADTDDELPLLPEERTGMKSSCRSRWSSTSPSAFVRKRAYFSDTASIPSPRLTCSKSHSASVREQVRALGRADQG